MPKRVYDRELPEAIREVLAGGMGISFSEGMLPYFLTRNTGVSTAFADVAEGTLSCYINPKGHMHLSSFSREPADKDTVFTVPSQKLWKELWVYGSSYTDYGEACSGCNLKYRCNVVDPEAYLMCARAYHNRKETLRCDIT